MMWEDSAYLLNVTREGSQALLLEVLTAHHGRSRGKIQLDPKKPFLLPPACTIQIQVQEAALGEVPVMSIRSVEGGLTGPAKDDPRLRVLTTIGKMAARLVPLTVPVQKLFNATRALIDALVADDGCWPIHYARWELAALDSLGYASGLDRCRPAFRHGEAIYLAPRTGRAVTRAEAGAFLDRMLPLPGFLLGGRKTTVNEIRQALRLTHLLIEKFVLADVDDKSLPAERDALLGVIAAMSAVPALPSPDTGGEDEELAIKRRMLAARPLMIAVAGPS